MKRVSSLFPMVALGIAALACSENPTATDPGTPPDVVPSPRASAGAASTYVVLYKGAAVPADAAETIAGAGGTLVSRFDAIGVAIARSTSSSFTDVIVKDKKVEGAAATAGFATQLTEKRGHAGDDPARAGGAEAAVTPDRAPYPAGA
jgi:hypothetical protein